MVERHWRKWRAGFGERRRWCLQLAALVVRANDKDAHVKLSRSFHNVTEALIKIVIVQIDGLELVGIDQLHHALWIAMGREPKVPHDAFGHQLAHIAEAAAIAHRGPNRLEIARPVEVEIVQIVDPKQLHGLLEVTLEVVDLRGRSNLRCDIQFFARHLLENTFERFANPFLGVAIAAGGFKMVHAQLNRTFHRRDSVRLRRLARELHAAEGELRQHHFRATKAPVFHGMIPR